jgi:hypothetical protein
LRAVSREIFKLPGGDRGRSAARNVMQASFASSLPLSWLATDRKMKKAPPNWVYIFALALFSYLIVGGAFVYDFLYGEIALHTRVARECQVIVGCDDGNETYNQCVARRTAELSNAERIR